jgi:integrase/recombinase XerD
MAQARTLSATDMQQLLDYVDTRKYAARNRAMLLTHWTGLRVGEVAYLRWCDVTTNEGKVKDEIRLLLEMTKGRQPRTVLIKARLKAELEAYVAGPMCQPAIPAVCQSKECLRGL